MSLQKLNVADFTEQIASKAPAPGGGGASALAAAVGIALGDMVGELTVGKKKYADVETKLRDLMQQAQQLRIRLLSCIDEDAQAFEPLSRAYGIPREDPDRDAVMEECLKNAALVPLKILDLCGEAMEIVAAFAELGSPIVLSDAACGAVILKGALYGAAMNVRVNLKAMKDREYAEKLEGHTKEVLQKYTTMAEDIYHNVEERIL